MDQNTKEEMEFFFNRLDNMVQDIRNAIVENNEYTLKLLDKIPEDRRADLMEIMQQQALGSIDRVVVALEHIALKAIEKA